MSAAAGELAGLKWHCVLHRNSVLQHLAELRGNKSDKTDRHEDRDESSPHSGAIVACAWGQRSPLRGLLKLSWKFAQYLAHQGLRMGKVIVAKGWDKA